MIKRITALLLAIVMMQPVLAAGGFSDVDSGAEYSQAIGRLVQYGILSGKGDGYFDPDAGLTRAEMAKIATIVGGLDSIAAAKKGTSLYADLDGGHWASGYINTVAQKGLILGYPNGTFAPEKGLTFAEAITIVLRLLGYTTDDLGNNWPSAYTAKVAELSLTSGLSYGDDDLINRKDIALVIDRALLTDMNGASAGGKKLVQLMNYTVSDECIVLATSVENKNLLADEVSTSIGTYKKQNDSIDGYVTQKVRLVLDKNNKVVNALPVGQAGKNITIQSVIGNEMAYTENGVAGSVKLDDSSVIYYQGAKKTFGDMKASIEVGMPMAIYYSGSGVYDYAVIKDFELLGPVVVTSGFTGSETYLGEYPIEKSGLRVIRDGFEATLADIKAYDVAYYNRASNIISVYCDKVSGVYEKAIPNKASITSLSLSGVTYALETQTAAKQLGEYPGAYAINAYVTLLLGRDGKVVSVQNTNAEDLSSYGVILETGERISEVESRKGVKEYYLKAYTVTGIEQVFATDQDYAKYKGRVIKYKFEDGILIPQIQSGGIKVSGKIDLAASTVGGKWVTGDTKIIDLTYTPPIGESTAVTAKLVKLSDIPAESVSESDVVYAYVDNRFGDIQFLVLSNLTLGRYQFGVLTDRKTASSGMNVSGSYTIDIGGTAKTYNANKIFSPQEGMGVMAVIEGNTLEELRSLTELSVSGKVTAIDGQRVRIGETSYRFAAGVSVYLYKNNKYLYVPISEISSYALNNVRLFADKAPSSGGLVRVMVFTE